jgi:hypothetical protein
MPYIRLITQIQISKKEKAAESSCTKNYKAAAKFGPGTILYWCAEHRFCLGYEILESPESCQHIHNTLCARFKQLPEVIIYDNACNLLEQFLNRNPEIIRNTIIVSDKFHWVNHTNCVSALGSQYYRHLDGKVCNNFRISIRFTRAKE